ncbi:hypothetical protein GCM10010123_01140 [Pilimelia anulata]|uniref:Thiazolinyl imide reductase n=1 Tax=Pilimelia anulata TaxID=53371 RepID=A0A8J3AZ19_9ACTN|nr:Gfo/Idh/MocA family oxidoreductase [Pilimelia anulata]GGJ74934.1 hypothetical protein GCM10010123_01140 [Pilimelia anulata]
MRPLRVVVAGTGFGRVYLDAVAGDPAFALAGVLARGSERSRALAAAHGVPFHATADEVPDDVDIACVVLRSGATGGPGAEVARALLARGIHVLHEHPVHAAELTDCLRAARAGGAAYAVHTLYPWLRPVRKLLAVAAALRAHGPVRYLAAATNSQVAYPLVDILGRLAGGLRPWAFADPAADPGGIDGQPHPFRLLHAAVGGVPVTLRVQNEVHPDDPDNHAHLMHRIEVGFDGGLLTLADTHGPVTWQPRLHAPRDHTGRLVTAGAGTERLAAPSHAAVPGTAAGSFHDVFADLWPDAVRAALHDLAADIGDPARRAAAGVWALGVSQAWADLTGRLGMPRLIRPAEPPVVAPALVGGAW